MPRQHTLTPSLLCPTSQAQPCCALHQLHGAAEGSSHAARTATPAAGTRAARRRRRALPIVYGMLFFCGSGGEAEGVGHGRTPYVSCSGWNRACVLRLVSLLVIPWMHAFYRWMPYGCGSDGLCAAAWNHRAATRYPHPTSHYTPFSSFLLTSSPWYYYFWTGA